MRQTDTALQPALHKQFPISTLRPEPAQLSVAHNSIQRHVTIHVEREERAVKLFGRNANHGGRSSIEKDLLPHDARVPSQFFLPIREPQDNKKRIAGSLTFSREKQAAEHGLQT